MINRKRNELHNAIDQLTDAQIKLVATVIEQLSAINTGPAQPSTVTSRQKAFEAMLDRLAKAPPAPELRNSTFSREMIYGEHD